MASEAHLSASERRIADLESDNRRLRHLLRKNLEGEPDELRMESGVNEHGKAFIHYRWGDERSQWSPEEAKTHALKLIEVACRCESDAAVFAAIVETGGTPNDAANMLAAMRIAGGGDRTRSATG